MKKSFWVTVLILLIAGGAGLYRYLPLTQTDSSAGEQIATIEVLRTSLQTRVSETGTIQPARIIEIKSQFSGEVSEIHVSTGQEINKDQILVTIQQEPNQARQIAQLRAAIQEERLNVELDRLNWIRAESLFKQGFAARNEMENAQQVYQRGLVRLELAERQLLLALGGNRELYERYRIGHSTSDKPEEFLVRSPSRATVLDILVNTGEIITSGIATVGGGTILMQIADLSQMVVRANINEVNIPRISVGQMVEIRLDALPGQIYEGRVTSIATQGVKEENIVTYEVSIQIDNTNRTLKPMLTANIDIVTDKLENVLTVPLEVLRVEKGEDIVDVMVEGQPKPRKVRVSLRTDTEAVITKGLEEHDKVVVPTFTKGKHHS